MTLVRKALAVKYALNNNAKLPWLIIMLAKLLFALQEID
jgi:hypothetical protein